MSDLEAWVDQVLQIDSSKNRQDVLVDLKYTNSIETTINRILDGQFLQGTTRDKTMIILDSDDDDLPTESPRKAISSPWTEQLDDLPSLSTKKTWNDVDGLDNQADIEILSSYSDKQASSLSVRQPKAWPDEFDSPVQQTKTSFIELDSSLGLDSPVHQRKASFDTDLDPLFDMDDSTNNDLDHDLDLNSLPTKGKTSMNAVDLNSLPQDDLTLGQQDSDDDDLPLLSTTDFFDELLTQKRPTPVVQIEDDDLVIVDRKGKRKATTPTALLDSQENLTPKEIKKRVTEERKRQRLEAAQEKKKTTALEKQRLKEKKQLEKERTALFEKENRVRNGRTKVLQEMLVDIHPDFLASKAGQLVERVLSAKEATIQDLTDHELLPNYTIGWRRQCRSEWDSDSQTFVPLVSSKIVKEPVILVYLDTLTLINHVQSNTLDAWIDRLERDRDYQIMLLIEGLDHYYKKKMLIKRRQFASQVLNTEPTQKRKKHKSLNQAIEEGPGREEIEESLNYLQWIRHVMLVTTKDEQDTASWIESLTTDLALKRYKSKNLNTTYKISKSSHDPQDIFYTMLQEVQLCTPAIASSIMRAYPTLQALNKAYDRTTEDAELLLADLEVERSALHIRDRNINRVMSKKIYNIFNSHDPEQIIY